MRNTYMWSESGLVPRLITFAGLAHRAMTLGVRGLVVDEARQVLLVRHTYVSGWFLPGGGVEGGETLTRSLERELAEEGNIEILGAPLLHGIYLNRATSSRDHVALYLVRNFRQTAPYTPNREIAEARFFSADALPEGTTRATRARIDEALFGAAVSAYW
jgi:ADP-ribose pyrophosphatase YjhB (NUDIX family)